MEATITTAFLEKRNVGHTMTTSVEAVRFSLAVWVVMVTLVGRALRPAAATTRLGTTTAIMSGIGLAAGANGERLREPSSAADATTPQSTGLTGYKVK